MREKANKLLDMCRNEMFDPMSILENVLTNWMSADDADEFAEREYGIDGDEDDEEDEDNEEA